MGRIFQTRIPANAGLNLEDITFQTGMWIAKSPHLPDGVRKELLGYDFKSIFDIEDYRIETTSYEDEETRNIGIKYSHPGSKGCDRISTEIIYLQDNGKSHILVMQDYYSTDISSGFSKSILKPRIVSELIGDKKIVGVGCRDGSIPFKLSPNCFSKEEIPFVASFVGGSGGNRLPLIYMGKNCGRAIILPNYLAKALAGLGHVFVPERDFFTNVLNNLYELNLESKMGITISWPGNNRVGGVQTISEDEFGNMFGHFPDRERSKKLVNYLVNQIGDRLLHLNLGSVDSYNELKTSNHLKKLKKQREEKLRECPIEVQSKPLQDPEEVLAQNNEMLDLALEENTRMTVEIKTINSEREGLEKKIRDLNTQLYNLKAQNDSLLRRSNDSGSDLPPYGLELNLPPEVNPMQVKAEVIDLIKTGAEISTADRGRKSYLAKQIIDANKPLVAEYSVQEGDFLKRLKTLLSGSRGSMSREINSLLEANGFVVEKSGKHWRVTSIGYPENIFQEFASTGSENRGGKNAFADFLGMFY
ncbi:MAG: hypothetical protein ACOCXG_00380 [Nanoarchaeota archaeon]